MSTTSTETKFDLPVGIVLIKPKPGSKKFQVLGKMDNKFNVSRDGGKTYFDESQKAEYDKERFPKSRQIFRPDWSLTKRKWLLKDFPENSDKLNYFVKQCRLKYKENHPNAGRFIETADIWDPADPFFTHKQFRILANEGDTALNKSIWMDYLVYQGLLMNKKFAVSASETLKGIYPQSVKYILIDSGNQKTAKKESRERDLKIRNLYEEMNDQKRMAIALSLGLIRDENTDREFIDDLLWDFANSKSIVGNAGETKQEVFIRMAEMNTADLNASATISKAKKQGYLKKTPQGWMLFGSKVGKDEQEVLAFFLDKDNQKQIFRLQEQLEND